MDFSEDSLTMASASESGLNPAVAFGRGFLTRSGSTPVNAMSALQLACDEEWSARKENIDYFGQIPFPESSSSSSNGFHHQYVDNDGNHSSEEELEEINNKVKNLRLSNICHSLVILNTKILIQLFEYFMQILIKTFLLYLRNPELTDPTVC